MKRSSEDIKVKDTTLYWYLYLQKFTLRGSQICSKLYYGGKIKMRYVQCDFSRNNNRIRIYISEQGLNTKYLSNNGHKHYV